MIAHGITKVTKHSISTQSHKEIGTKTKSCKIMDVSKRAQGQGPRSPREAIQKVDGLGSECNLGVRGLGPRKNFLGSRSLDIGLLENALFMIT